MADRAETQLRLVNAKANSVVKSAEFDPMTAKNAPLCGNLAASVAFFGL
jgi:hypothetical protein